MAFFRNLTEEGIQLAYGFVGLEGPKGSGKSTTGGLLAAAISAEFCNRAPVAWADTEEGANFVQPIFKAEKIALLHVSTKSVAMLRRTIREAEQNGACVLLADSVTTFWRKLVRAYMEEHKITNMQFMMSHWNTVKEPWFDLVDELKAAKLHKIICGRGGFEFDNIDLIDDDGNITGRETVKGDHKMKGEGEVGHEPDVMLHMESMTDPNSATTGKQKRGKRGKVQLVAPRKVHVASVEKGRVWQLNGKVFQWADRDTYKPGEYKEVFDCFAPYFNFLNLGGTHHTASVGPTQEAFRGNEASAREFSQKKRRQEIACEEIKGALSCVFTADTGKDAATKKEVINALFETHSWTAVERMDPETLEYGALVCRKMKELALLRMPQTRDELLGLVKQAKDEVHEEQANGLLNGCAAAAQQTPVNEEMPF